MAIVSGRSIRLELDDRVDGRAGFPSVVARSERVELGDDAAELRIDLDKDSRRSETDEASP